MITLLVPGHRLGVQIPDEEEGRAATETMLSGDKSTNVNTGLNRAKIHTDFTGAIRKMSIFGEHSIKQIFQCSLSYIPLGDRDDTMISACLLRPEIDWYFIHVT